MEKAKFPMPTMHITQGYNQGTHAGAYALDLAGEDRGKDWVLAPFTGVIKRVDNASYGIWYWFESLNPVLCANGEQTYLTAMFGHDDKVRHRVGDVIRQGDHLCVEGTSGNASGNHCHMEIGKGKFVQAGWYKNSNGVYMIYNAVKPNEYLSLPNDIKIRSNGGYAWKYERDVNLPGANGKTLVLPSSATKWRVYPLDKAPTVGNECGYLFPSKFGGLTYDILRYSQNNVAVIRTRDYGEVQIYVAPSTGAIIK